MMQNNFLQQVQAFRQNVSQYFASVGVQVPQEIMQNPNAIIQMLMNSGKLTQQQYNQAVQKARQPQNGGGNPWR